MVSSAGCCTALAGEAMPDTQHSILRPFPSSPWGWKATAPVGEPPGLGTGQGPLGTERKAPRPSRGLLGGAMGQGNGKGMGSARSWLLGGGRKGSGASLGSPGDPGQANETLGVGREEEEETRKRKAWGNRSSPSRWNSTRPPRGHGSSPRERAGGERGGEHLPWAQSQGVPGSPATSTSRTQRAARRPGLGTAWEPCLLLAGLQVNLSPAFPFIPSYNLYTFLVFFFFSIRSLSLLSSRVHF